MKKSSRAAIKTLWVIFLIITLIILLPFVAYMLFWGGVIQLFEGTDSSGLNTAALGYVITGLAPVAVLGSITYALFHYFHTKDKRDIQEEMYTEMGQGVTLEEKKIIRTLTQNPVLSYAQLATSTGLTDDELSKAVKPLLVNRTVIQTASVDGAKLHLNQNKDV